MSLDRDKYVFWRDLFAKATQDAGGARKTPDGVFYYGKGKIDRFLQGVWKEHAELLEQQRRRPRQRSLSSIRFYKSSRTRRRSKRGTY